MSDSLQPMDVANWLLCPPLSPRVCSNSCSWSRWCHPTISSSVVPFSSCLQSFPVSESFPVSQFFTSGGQSIGVSAFPMNVSLSNEYSGLISFRIDWFDLCCSRDSQESSPALQFKSTNFWHSAFFMVQLSHDYRKNIALTIWTSIDKVICLCFLIHCLALQ